MKILLHFFEEKLNAPAFLVDQGDLLGRDIPIIAQENNAAVLFILIAHSSQQ